MSSHKLFDDIDSLTAANFARGPNGRVLFTARAVSKILFIKANTIVTYNNIYFLLFCGGDKLDTAAFVTKLDGVR